MRNVGLLNNAAKYFTVPTQGCEQTRGAKWWKWLLWQGEAGVRWSLMDKHELRISTRFQTGMLLSAGVFWKRFYCLIFPSSITQQQLLSNAVQVATEKDFRKTLDIITAYLSAEMNQETLAHWYMMHSLVLFKRPDKNRLWYFRRIWTNICPWCTVLFAGGRLSSERSVGVWYFIVPPCYLVGCACPPPYPVSKGPFQCGPRDPSSAASSTVSGTQSLTVPIKGEGVCG